MRQFARNAAKALRQPSAFALAILKQFRANQGLLLAGAVAYYALLSLVPLLILVVLTLTHIFEEADVLSTVGASLEFVVPGQSGALVGELRNFLAHRQTVGPVLLVMMLFFSSLAFTVLENAMSVIFFHRVAVRRRHEAGGQGDGLVLRTAAVGELGRALCGVQRAGLTLEVVEVGEQLLLPGHALTLPRRRGPAVDVLWRPP